MSFRKKRYVDVEYFPVSGWQTYSRQALKDRRNARRYRREYNQRQKILTILRE